MLREESTVEPRYNETLHNTDAAGIINGIPHPKESRYNEARSKEEIFQVPLWHFVILGF